MGFWGSLVSSAVDVGHWVANNSGSIAQAAGVVAKVAGLVLTEEDIAQDDNILATLAHSVERASSALSVFVKEEFPAPNASSESSADPRLSGPFDLSALWPEPTSTDSAKIPPVISADVNKFLALNRLPNSLGKLSNATDIGASIAQQIFSNNRAKVLTQKNGEDLISIPINVEQKGGLKITGGHVYYRIPIGNPGDTAWHSQTRLWLQTPKKVAEEIEAERKELFVRPVNNGTGSLKGTSHNTVTISVTWTGARNVAQLMKKALDRVKDPVKYQGPSVVDGTKFTYQFSTPTDVGPAEVVAKLSQCINEELPDVTDSHFLPRMPDVKIQSMRTLIG